MENMIELVFSTPSATVLNYKKSLDTLRNMDINSQNQYHLFLRYLSSDNILDLNVEKIIVLEPSNFKIVGTIFNGYYTPLLNSNYPATLSICSSEILSYFSGPIDLNQEFAAKCVLIAFISEAARSKIVEKAFHNLLLGHIKQINLDRQKQFLYTMFERVCLFNSYKNEDGSYTSCFRPLELEDYERYYQSTSFKGDKETALKILNDIIYQESK
ncbi:MAG: hypothetical protein ACRCTJ_06835 [Brevinema sp.]